MESKRTIRGREITNNDIILIQETIAKYFSKSRRYISRQICHAWKWYQPNGQTKDLACRYILLSLERDGFIKLPPPLHNGNNQKRQIERIRLDEVPLKATVKDHPAIKLNLLTQPQEYKLFNRIIHTYHYQGYRVIVGKFLKYIAYIDNLPVACLGWGSSAWSIAPREQWIGWDKQTKDKNLNKIVNNIRFLILPWIKIKYLASHLLSLSAKQVPQDWLKRYGEKIYILETFVERERFKGTSYKAANWIYLGSTKGSAKRGSSHHYHGNIKDIYVYPLCKDFREKLINNYGQI